MEDKFTFEAFVLAGGKSSRMGYDKGLMDFHGKKMIEHVLQSLSISPRTSIITDNEVYSQFGYPLYADIYKNSGPLGGIHSGLYHSNSDWCITVSCDLPFVSPDILNFLLKNIKSFSGNAIVPVHDNKAEPLCALYHKSCLPDLERLILKKVLKMHSVLDKLNKLYVEVPKKFDADLLFRNMNTPADISLSK